MYQELTPILQDYSVVFAYAFGSKVNGYANAESDLDIAVMLPRDLQQEDLFNTRLDLISKLSNKIKQEVDVIILNSTPSLLMKYLIVSKGQRIYTEDLKKVLQFECLAYSKYFDFRPFLEDYRKSYVKRHL